MEFVDLKAQYARLKPQIDAGIAKMLAHGRYISGPEVGELETELARFTGSKHAITCANGTDALVLALMAYDVGPGDAIITTPFSFFATSESIMLRGATPVFCDIDPDTYLIDPVAVEATIEKVLKEGKYRLRGIMPVDLFGLACDYTALCALAKKYNLFIIQDAAQGFGASDGVKRAPAHSNIGTTSFFPAKPLGCYGDGGAIFTDDDALAAKLHSLVIHGKGTDKYDNVRIGTNSRLDTLQAAVLLPKLAVFEEEIHLRQQRADRYTEALSGKIKCQKIPAGYQSVWAQFCLQSDRRTELQSALKAENIPSMIYYPTPLHRATALAALGYAEGSMPNAEKVCREIFAVPMSPYLTEADQEHVISVLLKHL